MKRSVAAAVAFVAAAALAPAVLGCAGVTDIFREPQIRLDHVVVRGLGLTGGTLDLVVDVHNPNNFSLQGTKLRVGFDVERSHVGDVTYDSDFTVANGDTTRVTLPLTFQWAGVGGVVRTALGHGEIPYTMKGEAEVRLPFGSRTVPFTPSGRVPVARPGGKLGITGN
jgi:hypothetical protein